MTPPTCLPGVLQATLLQMYTKVISMAREAVAAQVSREARCSGLGEGNQREWQQGGAGIRLYQRGRDRL